MEDNRFQKFIHVIQDKFKRNSKGYPSINEYAFSNEEMDELRKENKEKILELQKESVLNNKKSKNDTLELDNSIFDNQLEDKAGNDNLGEEDMVLDEAVDDLKDDKEEVDFKDNKRESSFVHLEESQQNLIMERWRAIDSSSIDMDIIEGKDLLNHNYTITYADDAARFVHNIRKKYEVVLCYLIGFNNEKKGIYGKNYFSESLDDEWKYLNYYIKLLEKIRGFRGH